MSDDGHYIPDDEDFTAEASTEQSVNNPVGVGDNEDPIEIEDESSQLASTPGKNILLLVVLGVASVVFLYNMVFKETPEEVEKKKVEKIIQSQPVDKAKEPTQPEGDIEVGVGGVQAPDLPEFEAIQPASVPAEVDETPFVPEPAPVEAPDMVFNPDDMQPEAPATPKIEPMLPPIQTVKPENTAAQETVPQVPVGPTPEELAALKNAKRRQGMIVMNGGGSPEKPVDNSGVSGVARAKQELEDTSAAKVTATKIGNTDVMIAQGKMIDIILETAINTDLEGVLRAVISRDVYAESGTSVLIPKGSRLIGSYASPPKGQERVVIAWNRVIRPDGIDIALDSPGTDQMGRTGASGFVDNKYFDIISNAFLVTAVTIMGAKIVDDYQGGGTNTSSTTTAADGASTTSQTGTTTDSAVLTGITNISDVAKQVAGDLLNDKPTIIIQQGAKMKVFVNRDIHFPASIASSTRFIN